MTVPRPWRVGLATLLAIPMLLVSLTVGCGGPDTGTAVRYQVPVDFHELENGLRVVLSPDPTAPIVTVAVYYNIGFRIEPRNRTGFAHLFEHMMFQGSANLGKMEFVKLVQENGGILNGSTRFDFTNYFEILPAHKLETALWAEADRMRGLQITQENLTNQQGVVKNEVKVNVLNQPYGGFPWLDLPQVAFTNWHNAHNFYGDLADLDAATLEDVQQFFDSYYAPNNAAVVVVGDFDPAQARTWIERYFGDLPPAELAPRPDLTEPPQEQPRSGSRVAEKASQPALAVAYAMPERNSPEYYAMGLLDQILLQGNDSRLHRAIVQERGLAGELEGGINPLLGNLFNYNGPMLWQLWMFHDDAGATEQILDTVETELARVRDERIDQATLDRARVKMRSDFYDIVGATYGFGRADLLASFALFDNDPGRINRIEERFDEVTPELIQRTAREFLSPEKITTYTIVPGGAGGKGGQS